LKEAIVARRVALEIQTASGAVLSIFSLFYTPSSPKTELLEHGTINCNQRPAYVRIFTLIIKMSPVNFSLDF
jgi:hypothetical protein